MKGRTINHSGNDPVWPHVFTPQPGLPPRWINVVPQPEEDK